MDPYHKGTCIPLASSPASPLCPVTALQNLYSSYSHPPIHPLFSHPFGQSFTKFIINKIRELLLRTGIPTLGFSNQSIYKGAAVTSAMNGVSKKTSNSSDAGKVMLLTIISIP